MLAQLLEVNSKGDPMGVEETRMRAATLLCKVLNIRHLFYRLFSRSVFLSADSGSLFPYIPS